MIKIKNITKLYGQTEIFKNASYIFRDKGLVCLLGPSGSGKSTLLNLIAGFDSDYNGSISYGDINLSNLGTNELCNYRKDHVGFIFQDYHLISGYTVLENILLPCDLLDSSYEANLEKAYNLLVSLGIESKKDEKIENLSGGQKQRVSIARALIKNPTILLADEPTGALDRTTSKEIMDLLKSISKNILVIIITHDNKLSSYTDEIIQIKDKSIVSSSQYDNIEDSFSNKKIVNKTKPVINKRSRAIKNSKLYIKQFITIAFFIAIGISSFILSLSSQNIMYTSIENFKEKNTVFNNGYIKISNEINEEDILKKLLNNKRITSAYYQFKLNNIKISYDDKEEILPEYVPMPKTSESLSYGTMPRSNYNEIAITPSLAKKLSNDISSLIGKTITLMIENYSNEFIVSGIYNAGYDSIFISSNVEVDIYNQVKHYDEVYSISYDVNGFEDVISVNDLLIQNDIKSTNASQEVHNLINTFNNIKTLFLIVSILIFVVGLSISTVLLSKLQTSRFREIGLLSALGFHPKDIQGILFIENIILSSITTIITVTMLLTSVFIANITNVALQFTVSQIAISMTITFILVYIISTFISIKLIKTEPAKALRM